MNQEQFTCYVCGRVVEPTLVLRNVKDGWHIKRCPSCRVTFAHPQPDADTIKSVYDGLYSDLVVEYGAQKMWWARRSVEGYASTLARLGCSGKRGKQTLLDLGGGLGYYTKAFSEAGFSVTLVEQDPVSATFARNVLEVENVVELDLDTFFATVKLGYDVVFLRHVIEHLTNPVALIQNIAEKMSDGGVLVIETPNNAGIEWLFRPGTARSFLKLYRSSYLPCSFFSLIKRRPFAVRPPHHLFGFRMSNLAMLLEKNALIPVEKIESLRNKRFHGKM